MSLFLAPLFMAAFALSIYAIVHSATQNRSRIEAVLTSRGRPPERKIILGNVRHTGQKMRLVVVNELDREEVQTGFVFSFNRAA